MDNTATAALSLTYAGVNVYPLKPASSAKPLVCPFFRLTLPLLTFLGPLPASVAASISSCVMLGIPGIPAACPFPHMINTAVNIDGMDRQHCSLLHMALILRPAGVIVYI